ncbi:MAG: alpha/beta fold hydrolase [Aestuariibacter sp.]
MTKSSIFVQAQSVVLILALSACATLPNTQSVIVDEYVVEYAISGSGTPTVIFESGFGAPMSNWSKVFPEVAKFSSVFAYNRRGYEGSVSESESQKGGMLEEALYFAGGQAIDSVIPGASTAISVASSIGDLEDDAPKVLDKRTVSTMVEELRRVLKAKNIEPPYVLVGHSLGGLSSLYFAKRYPQEVSGLVLVDSTHPMQLEKCYERFSKDKCDPPAYIDSLMRVLHPDMYAEFKGIADSGKEVINAGRLHDIPYVVITRGKDVATGPEGVQWVWPELQNDLASYTSHSTHVIAKESGHFVQNDEPHIVIKAIKDIVQESRKM